MLALTLATGAALADEYTPVTELMRSGQLPQAMAKAQQYLATKPRDPQMRFLKGLIEQDSGRPQDAITTYNTLITDYPELPEPYNNVAVLYAAQGQYDRARAALELAIRANSQYAIAHENLGDVYVRLASQSYQQSQRLDTTNTTVTPKLVLLRQLFVTPPAAGRVGSASHDQFQAPAPMASAVR
jgi:tetratricopeptide (TPR) repeat protein